MSSLHCNEKKARSIATFCTYTVITTFVAHTRHLAQDAFSVNQTLQGYTEIIRLNSDGRPQVTCIKIKQNPYSLLLLSLDSIDSGAELIRHQNTFTRIRRQNTFTRIRHQNTFTRIRRQNTFTRIRHQNTFTRTRRQNTFSHTIGFLSFAILSICNDLQILTSVQKWLNTNIQSEISSTCFINEGRKMFLSIKFLHRMRSCSAISPVAKMQNTNENQCIEKISGFDKQQKCFYRAYAVRFEITLQMFNIFTNGGCCR